MKLISYSKKGAEQMALLVNGKVYDSTVLHKDFPKEILKQKMLMNISVDS